MPHLRKALVDPVRDRPDAVAVRETLIEEEVFPTAL
jgi:hypothetical protein